MIATITAPINIATPIKNMGIPIIAPIIVDVNKLPMGMKIRTPIDAKTMEAMILPMMRGLPTNVTTFGDWV